MPLYSYRCELCGEMPITVPLAKCGEEIACPLCQYNKYVEKGGVRGFDEWLTMEWEQQPKDTSGESMMHKLIDAPFFEMR